MGIVLQIQTGADIENVFLTVQTPLIQHGDHADAELCLWNLDTIKRTRKNDTIDSTQNASPHRSNKERESAGRKLNPANMKMMRKTEKQTTEAQTKKLLRATVQIPIATETATFPLRKTSIKRVTRAKSKKEIGSST